MDITGTYPTTLRGNKYFLAFTNQLTKYAEAHYVNANHKNWDEFESFYLMSHRATPHTTKGYSPFYLLHGSETILPSTDNLKARLPKDNTDEDQRLENMKSNLRSAYKLAPKANRKYHINNKRLYDRKAKPREFEV